MVPLRVLHVLEAVRGGTSRHVADVVDSAQPIEHHVAVPPLVRGAQASGAVVDGAAVEQMRRSGAQIHHVDMRRTPVHPANVAAAVRLRRHIRRLGPDVIHGHSSVGGALARAAATGTGIPTLYTPNGLADGRAALAVERLLGPRTERLIAVSPSEGELAVRRRLIRSERLAVIPNGIDLHAPKAPGELRAELGLPAGTTLVGTVARLVEQKAPLDFVGVCAQVGARQSDAHFLLIGMGPMQADVDAAVARSDLGTRWHQVHHLPNAAAVLDQLDVFVLPSLFEGGPYTPLEAMRAGVPVVLSDVVGNRDAVEPGVSGVLCPFGATAAMADAVIGLLQDPARRAAMVVAGTERLRRHFDVRLMGAALVELYEEVSQRRPDGADVALAAARRPSTREPAQHPQAAASRVDVLRPLA
jgi:glycosyltransferase involved in cell wall biosynthesis